MKAIDLLKYLELADPAYVAEASDCNLLLYRKRRKRTIRALAACFALVVLGSIVFAKPALHAWETRNTVTSWSEGNGFVYIGFGDPKPSASVMISAEMPAQKRFAADTPFTLSVGMGQVADYEYATLSVTAHGFEITDKDGNTATDRYVRTLSSFNSGDYGVTYNDRHKVTGCTYLEDFTLRFVGSENATGWGVIEFSLQSRDESSTMGDSVTVYYTIQNGVLKLTHKNPVRDGSQNGSLGAVLEETDTVPNQAKTVEFSYGGDNITVSVTDPFLARGEAWQEKIKISGIPMISDYMVALYPKDTTEGRIIRLMLPTTFSSLEDFVIPADALLGSYDLVVTWYGFLAGSGEPPEWVFEDFVTVTEPGTVTLSKEDFSVQTALDPSVLYPGMVCADNFHLRVFHIPTQQSYSNDQFTAELIYAETLRKEDFSFPIMNPAYEKPEGSTSSWIPSCYLTIVPHDAPIGSYDLRVTDPTTGFVWVFENMAVVLPNNNPAYEDFVFESDPLGYPLAQGDYWPSGGWEPLSLTLHGEDMTPLCRIELEYRTEADGEAYSILLEESCFASYVPPAFVSVDAPAGWYDLVVTYAEYGYSWRCENYVEIIENPDAERYGLYHSMGEHLRVSLSANEVYTFVAKVENRSDPVAVTVTPQDPVAPEVWLTIAYPPADSGELFEIPLDLASTPYFEPYEWTWQTGKTVSQIFEIMVTPDTPCGLYDLTLTYEDCTVTFKDVVEVVP